MSHPLTPPEARMVRVYLGLGSNLDHPVDRIRSAREAIGNLSGVDELGFSALYRSAPMGPQDQPDYINAVMAIETTLAPLALLDALQAIETRQGRVRHPNQRWGARTLDIDILLYGSETRASERLSLPHPGLAQREFVLYPLMEIAPDLEIPGKGRLADLVQQCPRRGLLRIEDV
jgi:2-amino-4-hydroxy-6-hydroxymethyldihydropteridine diphosphokinase